MNRANDRRFLNPRWPVGLLLGLWAFAASASAPPGRYSIPGDGTVHDTKTGLVWQQAAAPDAYTWSEAGSYCSGLSLAGTGWRLPSIKELMTLVDFTVAQPGPTIDATAFPNTPANWFWSSSPAAGSSSYALAVNFGNGEAGSLDMGTTNEVWCVR